MPVYEVHVKYMSLITLDVEAASEKEAVSKAKAGKHIPGTENDCGESNFYPQWKTAKVYKKEPQPCPS